MSDDLARRWRGGAIVGSSRWWALWAYWPCASLTATPDEIRLSVLGWGLRFPRERVTRLTADFGDGRFWFWAPGLRIEHAVPGLPRFVHFRVWLRLSQITGALAALGYEVHDQRDAKLQPQPVTLPSDVEQGHRAGSAR